MAWFGSQRDRLAAVATPSPRSAPTSGLRSERGPILLAVMLSIGLVAIDATILATAVPPWSCDLGGFTQFPWLFSIYLLAQAVSVPIYGKLADLYGRKPLMLLGVGLFLVGSLLCGFAWSMTALIVFRAGAGPRRRRDQPIGMTILGDIYSLQERAKVQGYLASVWAMRPLIGPTLGGVFSDDLSWRWIFFVNLPLGAAADVDAVAPVPRAGRAQAAPDRLPRRRAARRRRHAAAAGSARGRRRAGRGARRPASRSSRPPWSCSSRSCWSSAAPPSRCCRCGCSGSRVLNAPNAAALLVGRADDRPVVVRAAVRAGGAGHGRRRGRTSPWRR